MCRRTIIHEQTSAKREPTTVILCYKLNKAFLGNLFVNKTFLLTVMQHQRVQVVAIKLRETGIFKTLFDELEDVKQSTGGSF